MFKPSQILSESKSKNHQKSLPSYLAVQLENGALRSTKVQLLLYPAYVHRSAEPARLWAVQKEAAAGNLCALQGRLTCAKPF